jgi:enoyl-CoA hydratase/carnithine racemase
MCALYLYPGPTVALVNGHAIAGGCVLAQCCDYRVATSDPKTKLGLNEVALGVRFPPRVLAIVNSRLPRRFREEVILGAGVFSSSRARELGLVDEVSDEAPRVAREKLAALAAHPAAVYALTKRDLRGSTDADVAPDAALDAWMKESVPIWTSDAVKQKIAAVLRR